jgi:hypothetical protein
LKKWFISHVDHPYLNEKSKLKLAEQTGLDSKKISNWFMNVRKRIWQPVMRKNKNKSKCVFISFIINSSKSVIILDVFILSDTKEVMLKVKFKLDSTYDSVSKPSGSARSGSRGPKPAPLDSKHMGLQPSSGLNAPPLFQVDRH